MYSHEIKRLLIIRNYILSVKEYSDIVQTSSQIDHVKYNDETNEFTMWTKDNYTFKFKIQFR